MKPDISVIVPVHNSAKFLAECLTSIQRQTFQNIEIICVNDGSSDNSGQILKEYAKKDKRIKIKTTESYGVGNARNVGLDLASGPYIFFMDSDDVLHHKALSHLMQMARQTNADIVCAKYKQVANPSMKDEKALTGAFSVESKPIYCFGQRPAKTPVTVWNKLFKKEVIGNIRFLPKVYYEDTAFTLEVFAKAQSCVLSPDITYLYRTGNHSIMRSRNTEQKINDFCQVLNRVDQSLKNQPAAHKLIFSTYLNPELLGLLSFKFGLSRHLRKYMQDHIRPIAKQVQKTSPSIHITQMGKTRLLFQILKNTICKR